MAKSSMNSSVPKPANQGGHGKAPVQGAKIQAKTGGLKKPGATTIMFSKQPAGTRGLGSK
jgi:hypothetical protein